MNLLKGLNKKQAEAVEQLDGPVLILAGAGSGKTKTLVHRIAHLLQTGVQPHSILAVTFTNKAAKEMRERVAHLLGAGEPDRSFMPYMGTFHSICVRLLRIDGESIGVPKNFVIFDEADRQAAIRQVMRDLSVDEKQYKPSSISGLISAAKNEMITPEEYSGQVTLPAQKVAARVFPLYQRSLHEAMALDFDDLIGRCVSMLKNHSEIRDKWRRQFSHIMIDEYQDTNNAQYSLVKLLVDDRQNLCVVGDDWQCLAPGTSIETKEGIKPIESVKKGDLVRAPAGYGKTYFFEVQRNKRSNFSGEMLIVKTKSGKSIQMTRNHLCFARLEQTNRYYVYLMFSSAKGYRIGLAKGSRFDGKKFDIGLRIRANQERADRMWVLKVCDSREKAQYYEALYAYKYGIPMTLFHAFTNRSMKLTQSSIDLLYEQLDTPSRASQLMKDLGIDFEYPHFIPSATTRGTSKRVHLNTVLFGDRRTTAKSPWSASRLSINTSDSEDLAVMQALGHAVRAGKSSTFRSEIHNLDYGMIEKSLNQVLDQTSSDVQVNKYSYITDKKFVFMPAGQLHVGMSLPVQQGEAVIDDTITEIKKIKHNGSVYDLDIQSVHAYIADGVVVHNSIYSWRGADFRNILNFERDFPGSKVIKLEQNYRSTKNILDAAHKVITKNENRSDKALWTDSAGGSPVRIIQVNNEHQEAESVVTKIKTAVSMKARQYRDFAVLYRTNAQSRSLEDIFLRYGVPYRVVGGMRFYDRKEIKDLVAYIRFIYQPDDRASFMRVVNVPARGIGAKSLEKFFAWQRAEGLSLSQAVMGVQQCKVISGKAYSGLVSFSNLIDDLRRNIPDGLGTDDDSVSDGQLDLLDNISKSPLSVSEFVDAVIRRTQYIEMLDDGSLQSADKIEIVKEFTGVAKEYNDLGLEVLLEEVALLSSLDDLKEQADAVTLMTVHGAKGLEFPVVFMVGMEESIFPHSRALFEPSEMEEERRLCYVGMTRAREELYLYYANSRMLYGNSQHNPPSRFLSDIDGTTETVAESNFTPVGIDEESQDISSTDFILPEVGTKVRHQIFGNGTIVEVDGEMVSVAFAGRGVKKLNAAFAPLEVL